MKTLELASVNFSGISLVEASAGTGKTWTIAALYIMMLLELELLPEQIPVVTYTKNAASELRERIRSRIADTLVFFREDTDCGDDELKLFLAKRRELQRERSIQLLIRAVHCFDEAAIYTIHGFCQRLLQDNIFESGSLPACEMISDQSALVKEVCDDFWRNSIMTLPEDEILPLLQGGYTPEKLAAPFIGHFQNPNLLILPKPQIQSINPLLEQRAELFAELRNEWNRHRDLLLDLLGTASLHQQSYSLSRLEAAAMSMDDWLAAEDPGVSNNKLHLFTAENIVSRITKKSSFTPDHPFFDLCTKFREIEETIGDAYLNRIIACSIAMKNYLETELPKRKRALNKRFFDDLLLDVHSAIGESGSPLIEKLSQRYKGGMIDEFQDTDPLQWEIFQQMAHSANTPLFLIGDPKQAIYSFRGADFHAYLKAGRSVAESDRYTLQRNYRSDKSLLDAVATVFSANENPFRNSEIPFRQVLAGRSPDDTLLINGEKDNCPMRIWIHRREDETGMESKACASPRIAAAVAAEISRLLLSDSCRITASAESSPLAAHDITVLVRTHQQGALIQEALYNAGINSVQQGSRSIFESSEAVGLLQILRAALEPQNGMLVREALASSIIALTAKEIAGLVDGRGENPEWELWLDRFRGLHTAGSRGGIINLVSNLLGNCGIRGRILARPDGERCLTNLLHCSELLHQAENEPGMHLSKLHSWLERKISENCSDDTALLRLESDENAVRISTIHASKGLQYPLVFIPFAWDLAGGVNERTLFHNEKGELTLDLSNSDEYRDASLEEKRQEGIRLLYVAMTRAEFRCYIVWGAIKGATESPLFSLLHINHDKSDIRKFAAMSDSEILSTVRYITCSEESGISVELLPSPDINPAVTTGYSSTPSDLLSCRELSGPIHDGWRISSFSSIISTEADQADNSEWGDWHEKRAVSAPDRIDAPAIRSIFYFPRGAKAGTCLHEIFERVDFTAVNNKSIRGTVGQVLAENGFDEIWTQTVSEMVLAVTEAPIIPHIPSFSLRSLSKGGWKNEMEFYLPVKILNDETLKTVFDDTLDRELFADYYSLLDRLSLKESHGFLQGYIDLVFCHEGRYYIVDWKSNHLGMNLTDYGAASMRDSMCRSAYILQYHIYTLALNRHLASRVPKYDYNTHFGGVAYIYLRGITAIMQSDDTGIFFCRPSETFIRRSEEYFLD